MDIANVADNAFDNSGSSEPILRVVTDEIKVVPITPLPGPDTIDDGIVNTVNEGKDPLETDEMDEIFNRIGLSSDAITDIINDGVIPEAVKEVEADTPQYFVPILPNTYEVLMPVDFWNNSIKTELDKYGLPPETQPTDFFNFLIVNRDKLATPTVQKEENKELTDTAKLLESIIKLKTDKPKLKVKTWWIVAAVAIVGAIAAVFYFKKGVIIPQVTKNTSWI